MNPLHKIIATEPLLVMKKQYNLHTFNTILYWMHQNEISCHRCRKWSLDIALDYIRKKSLCRWKCRACCSCDKLLHCWFTATAEGARPQFCDRTAASSVSSLFCAVCLPPAEQMSEETGSKVGANSVGQHGGRARCCRRWWWWCFFPCFICVLSPT